MTLQECYAALGGDFAEVSSRLPSEKFIQKYVLKFLDDGSFDLLMQSTQSENWVEAFRAAHTIKGMCQNLGFTRLYQSSSELSEALRHGASPQAPALLEQVTADYRQTADAIRAFRDGLGA